jgi:FixJ family two-component response regulator
MNLSLPVVHVVDDDASFLHATARLLSVSGFAVKTYASADVFLAQCDGTSAGCVVADLQMPGSSGLELQAALAQRGIPMPIVFLTGRADTESTVRAMRAGAEDFLEKRAPMEALLDAVRRALARGSQEQASRARRLELAERFKALSDREREVLVHVLRGRLNKQIAGDLDVNERTVKRHRTAIMAKLKVRAVADLVRLAEEADEAGGRPAAAN